MSNTAIAVGAAIWACALLDVVGASGFDPDSRVIPPAYFRMPKDASGVMPTTLSQTGVFKDTARLVPSDGLLPYDLIVSFWSDGAVKARYAAVPKGHVTYSPSGEFAYPDGTLFVKTFTLPTDARSPQVQRRLETRILVRDAHGGVYGVDYKWRADNSDADLLAGGSTEDIPVRTAEGKASSQPWYFPSREDCLVCHNAGSGGVLGTSARQMNHDYAYATGVTLNQLQLWSRLGLFDRTLSDAEIRGTPTLAAATDTTRTLDDRARSYLDANCSHCHYPSGTVANFDARYETPLDRQALIDGPVLIDEGIDHPHVISPHDVWRSIAFMRIATTGDIRMPPIGRQTIDRTGVALLKSWIDSMPGRDVIEPPVISPDGGTFKGPVTVALSVSTPDAVIRYTLDGSAPNQNDARYDKPLTLDGPTVLRARAFKDGFTRSIAVQQVFVVNP